MTKGIRLLLLGVATTVSLAFAGSALAAFTPTLSVSAKPARPGASGTASIRLTVPRDDDAFARAQIFAPLGYSAALGQAIGTELGSVTAQIQVREPIAGAVLPITGTIRVADPTALVAPTRMSTVAQSVTQCTGTPTHAALWLVALQASGQQLEVPVAVDPAPSPLSAFASHVLTICLPNPNIPADVGGAPLGAKLVQAQLNIRSVFTTPASAGDYTWRAVVTPWPNGAGAPVAVNTREARGHILLPTAVTVAAKAGKKVRGFRTVTISGNAREHTSSLSGASIRITVGRTTKTVRTSANGAYRTTVRLRKGRYAASVSLSIRERTASAQCATAGPFAPIPCATETLPFYEAVTSPIPAADSTFLTASLAFRVK
jgi:hypothetical protein